jgi:hypothetical protein
LAADRIKGEFYFGIAESDAYVPMDMNFRLRAHLNGVGFI